MTRQDMLDRVRDHHGPWDFIVIGGGATGVGVAVDAVSRGYDVLLVEQSDFGKGTSSRSTKLVHGGVRYLQQGNVPLVMEALHERGLLRRNAPHLVRELAFVVPNYLWWEAPFYGIGMRVYDMLAGRHGFGHSRVLTSDEVLQRIPTWAARRRPVPRRPIRRQSPADRSRAHGGRAGRLPPQLRTGAPPREGWRGIRLWRRVP
jgi:glycerol-3-phosphate dehydrogenase